MKNHTSSFLKLQGLILSTSIILCSCGSSHSEKSVYEQMATGKEAALARTSDPLEHQPKFKGDSNRTFIRKANLSFKVKDVKTSTFNIEHIVNANNGYVTSSNLESTVNSKSSIRVSKDSVQDIINYTVQSNLIMRIPNGQLDKTLTEISALIDYLDYRRINAEDVTAQFQDATLEEKRHAEHKKRLEKVIEKKGEKLHQLVEAENNLLENQHDADGSKITTNELAHDVKYSTVAIIIYQKETTKKETYAYFAPVESYKPDFGSKLIDSLNSGVIVFEEILLFFIKLWPIALLITGCIFIFKSIRKLKVFN